MILVRQSWLPVLYFAYKHKMFRAAEHSNFRPNTHNNNNNEEEEAQLPRDDHPSRRSLHTRSHSAMATATVTLSPMAGDKVFDVAEKPVTRVEGLLRKRSSASVYMGSWRYCILHGSRLRWYMSAELAGADKELRGEVWVRSVEPWDGHGSLNTYPHAFAVRTVSGRVLLCSAPSADDKRVWLAALHESVDSKPSPATDSSNHLTTAAPENRRIVPEDMLRQPSEARSTLSSSTASLSLPIDSECMRCRVRFGALLSRRHLCGSCAQPFCSRHCAHLVTLAHLGLRAARRCCYACARQQELIAHLSTLQRFLTTVASQFPSMDAVVRLDDTTTTTASERLLLERTLTKLHVAPMSLVKTIKILYQTRRKPLLFCAACERLPFYVERAVDRVENLWYQLLHLFQCCDADAESAAVQLFYLRRYMRAICRRSPRIALLTIWHVQAAMGDASGQHPHSLLALLGFLYPPQHTGATRSSVGRDTGSRGMRTSSTSTIRSSGGATGASGAVTTWSDVLLAQCPDHQRREILSALAVTYAQSEALIAREPDSMNARWLNASTVSEFAASARELTASGIELCEFQTHILYDSLTSARTSLAGDRSSVVGDAAAGIEALVFDQVQFVQALAAISERLRHVQPPEQRGQHLEGELAQLNARLSPSALYPLCTASDDLFRVVRIPPAEGKVFTTKMRAPTLIFVEIVPVNGPKRQDDNNNDNSDDDDDDPLRPFLSMSQRRHSTFFEALAPPSVAILGDALSPRSSVDDGASETSSDAILGGKAHRDSQLSLFTDSAPEEPSDEDRDVGDSILSRPVALLGNATGLLGYDRDRPVAAEPDAALRGCSLASSGSHKRRSVYDNIVYDSDVYGESWDARKARIQRESPFGHVPGWQLCSVIVKTNDDLRQEVFTMQLIHKFQSIFAYESLRLWLRTYRIVATGANIGLLETITDACSLDHLKKHVAGGNLVAYFERAYGEPGSAPFEAARRNFIESMAAYSVVSYLLLVKDRHNGNLLLSTDGHIIHIDFGFILGIAPGGRFSVEDAPFKLTAEMVDVMGGLASSGFAAYRQLMCEGFVALQKYHSEIAALLQTTGQHSPFPCFETAKLAKVVADLRDRLCVGLSRQQVARRVDQLLRKSYNAWGTRQYDAFQLRSNNIHP